jgi:colanic acid biosynthesis glycosyl transferase WcaI
MTRERRRAANGETSRILLLTAYFPPDTGSAAHLFYELGTALAKRGHRVTVITGLPSYHAQGPLDRYKGRLWIREAVGSLDVVRVAALQLPRRLMVGRALSQFSMAVSFFIAGMCLAGHDVAIAYSPPLPLGLCAGGLKWLRRTPFILNVQDLFPQSLIDLGLLRNRWIIRAFEGMERLVYRWADAITVHSEGNRRHVLGRCAAAAKVKVIPNWVDVNFIRPAGQTNGFRKKYNLGDAFVVSFAGVLGYSQDLDVVLEAAQLVPLQPLPTGHPALLWLIVGDGIERTRLEEKAQAMHLNNVRFLPMQARTEYPAVLHASDVCLVTLHAEVKTPVVPSKLLSIMAAGRPVVAAFNLDGDAPRLVAEARCGLCVPPEDPRALADAVLKLYRDPSLREELGRNGRVYAEETLSLDVCVVRVEAVLREVMSHE